MAARRLRALALCSLLLAAAGPALALYKVVAPDGSVTYTDRPPLDTRMKVMPMGADPAASSALSSNEALLPPELRRVMGRFPVLLYTAPDCVPCDTARQWLQQRGIPYAEKQILGNDDAALLERSVGGRSVPVLTVGAQVLHGMSPQEWAGYLDAAGYPRESRLPASYQYATATPIVERRDATSVVPPPAAPAPARPAEPAVANPSGIKF